MRINKPYLALFISVTSVSSAAVLIVTCQTNHSLSIAFYRLLFTTCLIFPFVVFYKKTRREILGLPSKDFLIMFIIGVVLACHFAFWVTSLRMTSVASSVILVTAHPLLVGPVSHFFLKERLSRVNSVGIVLSVCGVVVLVYGNYGFSSNTIDTLEGNILAILGGVAAGLYILGGRKVRKTVSIGSYAFIVYGVATVFLFFFCIGFGSPIYGLSSFDYGVIFLMAIMAGILGHTLYNWSLEYIRASIASVVLLVEPIGSSLLALALPWISQIPSYFTVLGGGIILMGIYLTAKNHADIDLT